MSHTLLLADDSTTVQRVVELTFANEDIEVVTVGDGEGAMKAIEREAPDIVLADVGMPGKNGYDVASFLRSDPARARIPVVLLTGAFEPLDDERCAAIGSREVLVKPFEPREVIGRVRKLLDLPVAETPAASVAADTVSSADVSAADLAAAPAAEVELAPATDLAVAPPTEEERAFGADLADEASEAGEAVVSRAPVTASAREPAGDSVDAAGGPSEAAAPSTAEAPPVAAVPVPPPAAGVSVLAQSFVTFLAVERGADPPALATARTDAVSARGETPPVRVTDAMLDDVVQRVVERVTETVLRDAVAEVVSRISERLAREEITRVAPGDE